MNRFLHISILLLICAIAYAQPVPNVEENIPHLMTFGNESDTDWGDDDFSQAFFFQYPKTINSPFLFV